MAYVCAYEKVMSHVLLASFYIEALPRPPTLRSFPSSATTAGVTNFGEYCILITHSLTRLVLVPRVRPSLRPVYMRPSIGPQKGCTQYYYLPITYAPLVLAVVLSASALLTYMPPHVVTTK